MIPHEHVKANTHAEPHAPVLHAHPVDNVHHVPANTAHEHVNIIANIEANTANTLSRREQFSFHPHGNAPHVK